MENELMNYFNLFLKPSLKDARVKTDEEDGLKYYLEYFYFDMFVCMMWDEILEK